MATKKHFVGSKDSLAWFSESHVVPSGTGLSSSPSPPESVCVDQSECQRRKERKGGDKSRCLESTHQKLTAYDSEGGRLQLSGSVR